MEQHRLFYVKREEERAKELLLRRVTEQRRLVEEPEEQRLAHERGKLARQRELMEALGPGGAQQIVPLSLLDLQDWDWSKADAGL
mmetsp:Transcript_12613/g.30622  ORF Transcript_12613/g.30622 Transcript_12613/m.30622 type:complete len:85 (-) Transcript_12613:244-498(-)